MAQPLESGPPIGAPIAGDLQVTPLWRKWLFHIRKEIEIGVNVLDDYTAGNVLIVSEDGGIEDSGSPPVEEPATPTTQTYIDNNFLYNFMMGI